MKAILLNRILLLLAFAGLYVAGVLSLGHLIGADVPCGGDAGCATVARHPASSFFSVLPVAYLGFLTYLGLAVVAAVRAMRGMRNSHSLVLVGYGLSAIGTIFSLYLQYQSFTVIHATCKWCIASAVIMVATLVLHAFLAQATESGAEPSERSGGRLDRVALIALPVLLLAALGFTGANMNKAAQLDDRKGMELAGGVPLGPEVFKKLTDGNFNSMGPKDARLTIIEFADLQCGACQSHSPMVKAFAEQFPDKIRLIYRHMPLKNTHKWAVASAAASEYAAEKGKFWDLAFAIMGLQRELQGPEEIQEIAKQVGLDPDDMQKRLANPEDAVYKRVVRDMDLAGELGVQRTPTFFLATKGGTEIEVATSKGIFEKLQSEKYKKLLNG